MLQKYTELNYCKIKEAVMKQHEGVDNYWLYNIEIGNNKFDVLIEMNDFKMQIDYIEVCQLILRNNFYERSNPLDEYDILKFVKIMQHEIFD